MVSESLIADVAIRMYIVVMFLYALRMAWRQWRASARQQREAAELHRLANTPLTPVDMRERLGVLQPDGSMGFAVIDIPGANEAEADAVARFEKEAAIREVLRRRLAGVAPPSEETRDLEDLVRELRQQTGQELSGTRQRES